MKEYTITIRVDNLTMQMLNELCKWVHEDYNINPNNTEIIRAAIEQMHNKYYRTQKN